jgi:hypothetical protein
MTDQTHEEFLAERALHLAEIDRTLQENARMIERLGEKIGGFTEGMAYPSMQSVLFERLGMSVTAVRPVAYQGDRTLEIDVMAYGKDEVYVVEVKSHLREDGIQQMLRILREFHDFYPGHEDKKVYGILAAVDIPEDLEKRVLAEGIYLARIHDDTFEITVPDTFQPRAY